MRLQHSRDLLLLLMPLPTAVRPAPFPVCRCEAAGQLLILAAQLGKASVLKPLLALGASLDAVDEHGHQGPALLHAASAGNVNVVRALLEVRWAPHVDGSVAGMRAGGRGWCCGWEQGAESTLGCIHASPGRPANRASMLRRLLQAGASPDQQDVRGQSALIVAVLADRAAVAEVLLSAGADPNRADSFGATPIWYCGQFNALDCIPGKRVVGSMASGACCVLRLFCSLAVCGVWCRQFASDAAGARRMLQQLAAAAAVARSTSCS